MTDMQSAVEEEHRGAMKSRLALAFIVKNEGRYAVQMMESVLPAVGFVSCLDTGSSDNTVEQIRNFLENHGVPHHIAQGDFVSFDLSRNQAIENVPDTFDWVLMLDADEVVLEQDIGKLAVLLDQTEHDAWLIPRYNWIDRIGGNFSEHYPDHQGRLFRKSGSSIKYDGAIHECLSGWKNIGTVLPSDLGSADPSKELHIHHIKLFTKTHGELASREELYQKMAPKISARNDILGKLWSSRDPFSERPAFSGRVDFQGWASDNPLLAKAINDVRPKTVVEVGVWKGGSVITMGREMKALGLDGVIIAVDTWLGAWDHWIQPIWFESLRLEAGYPTLFKTFAANILESDLADIVVPLPLDSLNAAAVLKSKNIRPDVLHIDGAHDYHAVFSDLRAWWPLLASGGVLLGDDYHPSGDTWPEVREAFHDFFKVKFLENLGGKCCIHKTGE
jgi:glycosyltransferase involved in cell wall biosynthesis